MQEAPTAVTSDTHSATREPNAFAGIRIAVLIPCYNEEVAIPRVVSGFREALPSARVYVYDNNSTDRTAQVAAAAGATVRNEPWQGKGNVIRRMFSDIEADIYVLVDGDDTYHAPSAPKMAKLLLDENLDMVNGRRVTEAQEAYRLGHRFGNRMLTGIVAWLFGNQIDDMLSGYRVFSRRFVKSFPSLSTGFEVETELTVHALELKMKVAEVATPYKERLEGSESKLSTYRDGMRILRTIGVFIKDERPLPFFACASGILALMSIVLAWPIIIEFMDTGLVPKFPTAILATGVMLLAFISLACGLILDTVTLARREMKRMWYLSIPLRGIGRSRE